MKWQDYVTYDPTSPTFFRYKTTLGPKSQEGMVAGRSRPDKGVEINITFPDQYRVQRTISGARLAWIIHHGNIPDDKIVVCVDGDLQNLSLDNLTLMTYSERKLYRSLINDARGICKRGINGEWKVRIRRKNGPDYHYSSHPTEEEAQRTYRLALTGMLRKSLYGVLPV